VVHSGQFAAFLGPVGSDGMLFQTLATTAGNQYHLSYWLQHDGGTPSDFSTQLNGTTVAGSSLVNPNAFPYTQYNFDFTATGPTVLQFTFREDPAYFHLDDVSVTPGPVPEPASLTLFGLGLVPLAGYAWRRRKSAAS
jgi:hypothetical protein